MAAITGTPCASCYWRRQRDRVHDSSEYCRMDCLTLTAVRLAELASRPIVYNQPQCATYLSADKGMQWQPR